MSDSKPFAAVSLAPLNDEIIKVNEAFRKDARSEKLNLGIGVYRLENGALPVFESVKRAEQAVIAQEMRDGSGKGYAPIEGLAEFRQTSAQLIFGSELCKQDNIVTVQTIGGSGALSLAAIFAKQHLNCRTVHLTQPCWANHPGIFELQGYTTNSLPYYDKLACKLDIQGLLTSLQTLPEQSLLLLQSSCHNPSGIDLAPEDWEKILFVCKSRNLLPVIDLAYQGLAQSLDQDAWPARLFAKHGLACFIAHSFSKSLSLYGERVGSLSVVTDSAKSAQAVLSQLKNIIRPLYSNPPVHGSKMAAEIFSSPELFSLWQEEISTLRERIFELRKALVENLQNAGFSQDLSYIANGHGMFCLLKLSAAQVSQLAERFGIYIVPDGRTCIPALSKQNVRRVAEAIVSLS